MTVVDRLGGRGGSKVRREQRWDGRTGLADAVGDGACVGRIGDGEGGEDGKDGASEVHFGDVMLKRKGNLGVVFEEGV